MSCLDSIWKQDKLSHFCHNSLLLEIPTDLSHAGNMLLIVAACFTINWVSASTSMGMLTVTYTFSRALTRILRLTLFVTQTTSWMTRLSMMCTSWSPPREPAQPQYPWWSSRTASLTTRNHSIGTNHSRWVWVCSMFYILFSVMDIYW